MRLLIVHEHQTAPGEGGGGAEAIMRDQSTALRRRGHEVAWLQSPHIEQAVDTFKPDFVELITLHNALGFGPAKWLQSQGVPHVWTIMDYWPFCLTRNLLVKGDQPCKAVKGTCDNECGHKATWQDTINRSPVVALCEPSADILKRNGIRADYVIEPGIDTEAFRPRAKVDERAVYASTPWGMHPVKGMRYLADAVKGTGVEARLLTGMPRERVAEHLAQAGVYVFPSCYEETFGLALTEAMASGCACIASDVAGARAQIQDGVTGLLVPPRDARRLCFYIDILLSDPVMRQRIGEAARAHVEQDHTLDAMARRWEAVYEEVINANTASRRVA